MRVIATLACLALLVAGSLASAAGGHPDAAPVIVPIGLDLYVPSPVTNPLTREKIALGRRLFFERRLSRDGRTACATCHDPARAFTDGRRLPIGVYRRVGRRNTPSLLNRAYGTVYFWDGRAATLEDQVRMAFAGRMDLDLPAAEAVVRLTSDREYAAAFTGAFGKPASPEMLVQAVATFVRAQLSGASAFDRFVRGDREALTSAARQGFALFNGKARCSTCHAGPLFTDEDFHNTGVSWGRDGGRFEVTGHTPDRGRFKTPSLRNVARTPPYMHDGSLPTLDAVLDFYDRGGGPNPNLDSAIRPLHLTASERADLRSLLRALTGVR